MRWNASVAHAVALCSSVYPLQSGVMSQMNAKHVIMQTVPHSSMGASFLMRRSSGNSSGVIDNGAAKYAWGRKN